MTRATYVLITCEHGGNRVPARYRALFHGREALLQSHRGYDPGALTLARDLAEALGAPLFVATVSRLVIDLNRSIGHPRLYSEATREAPEAVRRDILKRHYLPFRDRVEAHIAEALGRGLRVIHVSSHSFTPVLDGEVRNADIGLLYDPSRSAETALCHRWQAAIRHLEPGLRVRRNYPYRGQSDGFTAYLRRRFSPGSYVGVELEINQRHVFEGGARWRGLRRILTQALEDALSVPTTHDVTIL